MMSATAGENVSHPSRHHDALPGGADPGMDFGELDLQVADKLGWVLLVTNKHVVVRWNGPTEPHVARQVYRFLVGHIPNAATLQPFRITPVDGQECHRRP